jgi:hypothetical protein
MSKAVVVKNQRQHVRIGVTQSLNAIITTIRMKMVVTPNIDVFRKGVLITTLALGS